MTDRLPALTPRQLIAVLQRAGFSIHHQTGSHVHLRAAGPPPRRLVIAFHNRELARSPFARLSGSPG